MGRKSTKENKNYYQLSREHSNLTRFQASKKLDIPEARITKIENDASCLHPDEVSKMAEKYDDPKMCEYYCAHECKLKGDNTSIVTVDNLSQIIMSMLSSLNSAEKVKDKLIDMTADGKIEGDELKEFVKIRKELAHIALIVETLMLWSDQELANGKIDKEEWDKLNKSE